MSMAQRDFYRTEVASVRDDAPVRELVERMAGYAVGCVVVVDAEKRPVGIVTDRDLAIRVVAQGRDPSTLRALDVMSKPLVTAAPDERLESIAERMRSAAVRRLPVVHDGRLSGLVALDDIVVELGRELDDLGEAARRAIEDARRQARRERMRDDFEKSVADLRGQVEKAGQEVREFLEREFESLRERLRELRK
jgi:CBS domain-containing protein